MMLETARGARFTSFRRSDCFEIRNRKYRKYFVFFVFSVVKYSPIRLCASMVNSPIPKNSKSEIL